MERASEINDANHQNEIFRIQKRMVNDLIMALSASGYGCYFHGMFVGSFVYADDLLLFPHHCVICS